MSALKMRITCVLKICIRIVLHIIRNERVSLACFAFLRIGRLQVMALAEIKVFHAAREAASLRERLPITRDILLLLPAHLDQRSHREATLYSTYCLAYAAFLRIGESIWEARQWAAGDRGLASWHAARRSITFDFKDGHPDRLSFILPASKTDPLRQGVTIIITAANDHARTVSAFHLLFTRWPSPPETHLFTLYHHDPDCVRTVLPRANWAFNRRTVVNALRGYLASAGIPGGYSGHSFRRGAATSARMAGVADHDIQPLGRWRSDAYKLY